MQPHILNCRLDLHTIKPESNLQFHIDAPTDVQEISENLFIQGWVVHPTQKIERIFLLSEKGEVIGSTVPSIHRPKVHKIYAGFCNSISAGFRLNISSPVAGVWSLFAETDSKDQYSLAQISMQDNFKPKLLFMHIAKTAGSSVNMYLASHYAADRHALHVESKEEWRTVRDWARNLGFVSGHYSLPHFKGVLQLKHYYKITVLREPYTHLVSHLAWIRKLADEDETRRLSEHPVFVQHFAGKLAKTDLSDPVAIGKLISSLEDKEKRLVDNCQVRYFTQVVVGTDVGEIDAQSAIEASAEFDLIGTTDKIDEFLRKVAVHMGWKAPVTEVRENVSRSYYGLDAGDKSICAALEPLVHFDLKLYRIVKESQAEAS